MTAKYSWAKPVSGDYGDAADWSPQAVPGSADAVQVEAAGTYTVTASQNEAAYSLVVGSDATLNIASGTFTVGSSAEELTVAADATITIQNGGVLQLFARQYNSQTGFLGNTQTVDGHIVVSSGGGNSPFCDD